MNLQADGLGMIPEGAKKKMELAALHPDQPSSPFEFAKKHQERQCCYLGILEEY